MAKAPSHRSDWHRWSAAIHSASVYSSNRRIDRFSAARHRRRCSAFAIGSLGSFSIAGEAARRSASTPRRESSDAAICLTHRRAAQAEVQPIRSDQTSPNSPRRRSDPVKADRAPFSTASESSLATDRRRRVGEAVVDNSPRDVEVVLVSRERTARSLPVAHANAGPCVGTKGYGNCLARRRSPRRAAPAARAAVRHRYVRRPAIFRPVHQRPATGRCRSRPPDAAGTPIDWPDFLRSTPW